jgi:hypothetical protein
LVHTCEKFEIYQWRRSYFVGRFRDGAPATLSKESTDRTSLDDTRLTHRPLFLFHTRHRTQTINNNRTRENYRPLRPPPCRTPASSCCGRRRASSACRSRCPPLSSRRPPPFPATSTGECDDTASRRRRPVHFLFLRRGAFIVCTYYLPPHDCVLLCYTIDLVLVCRIFVVSRLL